MDAQMTTPSKQSPSLRTCVPICFTDAQSLSQTRRFSSPGWERRCIVREEFACGRNLAMYYRRSESCRNAKIFLSRMTLLIDAQATTQRRDFSSPALLAGEDEGEGSEQQSGHCSSSVPQRFQNRTPHPHPLPAVMRGEGSCGRAGRLNRQAHPGEEGNCRRTVGLRAQPRDVSSLDNNSETCKTQHTV
jgi:hypothetical protein